MKAEYRITEDDYVKALQFHTWRHMIRRPAIMTHTVFVLVLGLAAWMLPVIAPFAALLFVVVLSLFATLGYVIVPYSARRNYRRYKAAQEPKTVELLDDGPRFSSADGEVIMRWGKIFQWRQNRRFVLIYPSPALYIMVPKSLEQQGFDIPLLVQRLGERVGPER